MAGPYNVGVIGYGLSAKVFHIPFVQLTKSLKLYAIVQRSPSPGNSAPADYPSLKHFTSADSMLQDPDVQVVIISTPPDTHFALASKALESDKHVLVEKPFVATSAEAEALAALAREHRRMLCVYQNRRWDSDFLTVRKLIGDGTLGRIYEFETHFDRYRVDKPATWKGKLGMAQAGGVLYDLGSHLIDQVYVLFGKPTAAYAKFVDQRTGRLVSGEGSDQEPDSINAVLSYADRGLLVHVRIGVLSVEAKQPRFWVRGSKGSYHKTGLDPQEDQLRGGKKASDPDFGKEDSSREGRLCTLQENGSFEDAPCPTVEPQTYVKLFELFGDAISSGKEDDVPVSAGQAADVLRIIEALKESARTGREVPLV
ncbi:NAD(P)-binding protein [Pleurostoma richardsiae]|uniref:NAD(P)-binding protein n=1 Tax=Pleurostoma richardsiae TaxID=41990 RepID=A0AA38RE63_9PEZI|nr:NAD(P)-binding protein [Pleurostoma richardsiae]